MRWRIILLTVVAAAIGLAYLSILTGEDDPASLRNIGRSYYEEENYAEAAKTFRKILAFTPGSAVDEINLGIVLVQLEQYEQAREHLRRGEQLNPKLAPQAAYNTALSYKRERDFAKAVAAFERVLKLDPSDPDAVYNLAVVYESLGQLDKAFEQASRAVELLPDEIAPHYRRMMIAVRQGKTEIATQEKNELTRLRGQDARNRTPAELEMSRYTEIVEPERTLPPPPRNVQPSGVRFADVTAAAGIEADAGSQNTSPAAISWVDLNGDSLQDLCLLASGRKPALWLNSSSGVFKPFPFSLDDFVPESAAHAWGDLDYDGDQDLCVAGKQSAQIFANDGAGKLTKAGEVPVDPAALRQLLLVDYDHDGDLDLYVAQASSPPRMFQNDGKAAFKPVPPETGLSPANTKVEQILFLDFDDDNDTDFLLSQVGLPNLLLSNLRVGAFADVAGRVGLDMPSSNRNVLVTDLNNDEWRDLVFLQKSGDVSAALGAKSGRYQPLNLGRVDGQSAALTSLDYDNDGDEDVLAGGRLFQNDGRFSDFTAAAGLEALGSSLTQASAEDLDGDGDLDLAVCLENGALRLLRNEGGNRNQWVRIRPEGLQSNRFGVATKVEVRDGTFFQRKICEGRPILFGIGQRRDVDVVRLWWPTGVAQNILGPVLRQTTLVKEKLGPPSSCPFLYLWDGREFSFFTDVLDVAALGVPLANGKMLPYASREDLLIPGSKVKYKDGRIVLQLTGELREIVYLDSVRLSYVDHSGETEIYPMNWAGFSGPASRLVSLDSLWPARKVRGDQGEDHTSALVEQDGIYASRGIRLTRFYGLADPHSLTLDLGDLSRLERPALLLQGWVNWIDGDTLYALGQGAGPAPCGPRLEIQNDGGDWELFAENIGLPGGINKHVIVPLPNGSRGKSTRVRVATNLEVYWDRAAVGNMTVRENPAAGGPSFQGATLPGAGESGHLAAALPLISSHLHFRGFSRIVEGTSGAPPRYVYNETTQEAPWKSQQGLFTRFGEVSPLLSSTDDRLVVFGPGDEITLTFAVPPAVERGSVRDYILSVSGWIKDANPSTRTGDRVEPLPTRAMRNYPFDPEPGLADRDYWETVDRYNTRILGRR
ncbi:MAG: FG-GAP-like repeat-containing protein [Acidobacteriota bacterium]